MITHLTYEDIIDRKNVHNAAGQAPHAAMRTDEERSMMMEMVISAEAVLAPGRFTDDGVPIPDGYAQFDALFDAMGRMVPVRMVPDGSTGDWVFAITNDDDTRFMAASTAADNGYYVGSALFPVMVSTDANMGPRAHSGSCVFMAPDYDAVDHGHAPVVVDNGKNRS